MKIAMTLGIGLAVLLLAAPVFALPPAPAAPACGPSVETPPLESVPPVPELKAAWTGTAYYDPAQSPNCTWTCGSGSAGATSASSEIACRKACNTACGPFCLML